MDRDRVEPSVSTLPGEKASRWIEYHRQFAANSTTSYDFVWDVTEPATGPFCTDVDGNVFLDFTSQVAAAPLGYNNPTLLERLEAIDLPTPRKIAGQNVYASTGWPPESPDVPGPAQLMERLTELAAPYDLDTVFLTNSGAEAVENAMKIAYDHRPSAYEGITFRGAFHGRTLGALSLNRSKAVHRRDYPHITGVHDLPYCTDRTCSPETCRCGFFTDNGDTSQLRTMLEQKSGFVDPEDLAYIILEPIQGEGGYRFPSPAFADEIQAICNEHDILLIVDEIQTGLGRTGSWWGSDHYAFDPDIIASAKALQVGATISREEIFPHEKGRISSTWGGGDIMAAIHGLTILDVIESDDLMTNAIERGVQLRQRLAEADLEWVTDIRGEGLMVALTFFSKDHLEGVIHACLDRGLLTLGCGHASMRLIPPLDVTEREIDLGADLLIEAIEETRPESPVPTDPTEVI